MSKEAQVVLICGVAGGVVLMLVLVLALVQGGPGSGSTAGATGHADAGAGRGGSSTTAQGSSRRRRPSWRMGTAPPPGPRTLADLLEAPQEPLADPDSASALLAAARRAMAGRNLDAARHHAEAGLEKARTEEEKAEAQRVLRLLGFLEQFWEAVRAEAGTLKSGQELAVGEKRLMILEATSRGLAFRHEGELYSLHVEELPVSIAVALAQRRLGAEGPVAHLCVGAFLAVDPKGDLKQAREHWQQAGTTGQLLLEELEASGPRGSSAL